MGGPGKGAKSPAPPKGDPGKGGGSSSPSKGGSTKGQLENKGAVGKPVGPGEKKGTKSVVVVTPDQITGKSASSSSTFGIVKGGEKASKSSGPASSSSIIPGKGPKGSKGGGKVVNDRSQSHDSQLSSSLSPRAGDVSTGGKPAKGKTKGSKDGGKQGKEGLVGGSAKGKKKGGLAAVTEGDDPASPSRSTSKETKGKGKGAKPTKGSTKGKGSSEPLQGGDGVTTSSLVVAPLDNGEVGKAKSGKGKKRGTLEDASAPGKGAVSPPVLGKGSIKGAGKQVVGTPRSEDGKPSAGADKGKGVKGLPGKEGKRSIGKGGKDGGSKFGMKGSAPSSPVLAAAAGDRVALGLASGVKFGKAPKGDKAKGGAALLQPSEGDKSGVLSKKGKIKGDKSGKYGKSKGPAQPQADARSAPITPRGAPSFVEESATVDDLVGTQGTTPLAPDEELRYAGLTLGDDRQMEQMLDLPFVSDDRNIKDGIPLIEQGGSSSSTAGQALEQQQLPSAYDDVTLIDQPYETPALSELEDTPAERVDQQMLALLRRLEKLPQPQDASKTSSWDELVCVTLVDVLQILPQEAVALLLKPSSSVPAGQPPGTDGVYRTLLYDVVLEAECPSTDMIVQPMQSLGMGLRLWLCDLLKLSAHIHLTEADFAPFCLFFGQLLTTGCADLALQLFHKILVSEKTTITRKAQADVFAWLVQTRALTDLVVLLRGAKPGSRDDPFLQAGPGGATSSADPLRGEYGSTHPAPAGGAGPLVEAEGRSERVSSPSRMLRGEDDSSPVRQEGGGDSSGCAKPFTGEQADRDDPDASGAGGDAASAPKLRQNASSKRLVGALSAYEDAVRKEFGSTSGRRAGYGYSGGTRTPTDIPLESIVDFLYFCSRDAQVDFLSRFLPEVAEPELLYKYGRQALRRTDAVESIYWQGALGPLLQITLADDDMHGLCFAAELVLCYHDRPLSPMSVDDACTSVLEKLRAFALELPATEDTYRAWSCLFFLVERFFEGQILRFTSAAYRTICCAFMERGMLFHNRADKESPKTDGIRTFALKLLIRFLAHPDVPVGVLAELLLKQLELLQTLSIADLDLIMALSGHERLGVTYGRRFLEVLGQACFQNPYFARAASIPFLKLVARFAAEDGIYEFMEGLTKIGLSYILKEPLKWRNALVVDLLTKVGNLHERVSEAVKKPVVEAAITYLQTFKGLVLQQSLRLILEVWPEELRTLQDTFYNMNYEEEDAEKAGGAASNGASLGDGQSPNHPTHIPLTHLQPKGVDEPIVNFNANPLLEGVELGKGEMS